jgi:hypothetical protein
VPNGCCDNPVSVEFGCQVKLEMHDTDGPNG